MHSLNSARFGVRDPTFSSVVQLAHFDTGLTNSCPRGNAIAHGTTSSISSAQSVFGGASLRNTTGTCPASPVILGPSGDYSFGTADWTIEFRYRPDSVATVNIFDMRDAAAANVLAVTLYTLSTGELVMFVNGSDRMTSASGVITAATWHAIAVSRVSGTSRMFVNGTSVASFSDSLNYTADARVAMGSFGATATNAYWDELRISNGILGSGAGRYAANYTPATAAFPNS